MFGIINKGIVVLIVANLIIATIGAQFCATQSLRASRGKVTKRPEWKRYYITISLATTFVAFLLLVVGTYLEFGTQDTIQATTYAAEAWVCEVLAAVIFWRFIAWESFRRKHRRLSKQASRIAAQQRHRAFERKCRRAEEAQRIHDELYETRLAIPAEAIISALDQFDAGERQRAQLTAEEAEIIDSVIRTRLNSHAKHSRRRHKDAEGYQSCVRDVVEVRADEHEVLRRSVNLSELAVANLRRDQLRHVAGKTVYIDAFLDKKRKQTAGQVQKPVASRQPRLRDQSLQARRFIRHQTAEHDAEMTVAR